MNLFLNINNNASPSYYHREYKSDLYNGSVAGEWVNRCKRITLVTLPLLCLYRPLGMSITLISGGLRTWTACSLLYISMQKGDAWAISYQFFHASVSGVGAVSTVIAHPVGMLITTAQDLLIEVENLRWHIKAKQSAEMLKSCIKIIDNILYLTLSKHGGIELEIVFLSVQLLLGLHHSYQEYQKGHQTEGYVYLLINVIRASQIKSLLDRAWVKWLVKSHLEVWKNHLSTYENSIKDFQGEKYLYFKKNDPREKFLILSAEDKAFHPGLGNFSNDLKKLNERYDVKFRTVSTVEEIAQEIAIATQLGKVTGLMLRAHGNHFSMQFGPNPVTGILRKETIPLESFSELDPNCVIVLDSCDTAKFPNTGIAYDVANQSQRVTYASNGPIKADLRLFSLNPLEWQFDSNGSAETKKIVPF